MNTRFPPRRPAGLAAVPVAASLLVMVLGAVVIAGWWLDIQIFRILSPKWATMKVNTAVCFVLAGLSLYLVQDEGAPPWRLSAGRGCAAAVAVAALLTLAEYALHADFGIDQVLLREAADTVGTSLPGRMSEATAFCFLLIGLAFLGLDWGTLKGHHVATVLFLITALIGLLAFIGYLYGVTSLRTVSPFSSMPVHTAMAFLLLAFGGLSARSGDGSLQIATSAGTGGVLARRLFPFAVGVPLTIGWLRLRGQRAGFYGLEFGVALFATSNILIFTMLIWRAAVWLNRVEHEREHTQAALRDSEARFNAFMEASPAIAWMKDGTGRYLYMNTAWNLANGRRREDWIGRVAPDAVPYEIAGDGGLEGPNPHRFVELSGELAGRKGHWNSTNFSFRSASKQRLVGGMAIDITEQKEIEQALRRSEMNYRTLVESASEGILITDGDGRFCDVNSRGCQMLGYTRDQLLALTSSDIVAPGEVARLAIETARLTAGEAVRGEWRFRRKDGTLFPGDVSATILPDGRLLGIIRDNTERRHAEAEGRRLLEVAEKSRRALLGILEDQQQAEEAIRRLNAGLEQRVTDRTAELESANKELEAFSYSVSHDLRAPLRAVDGFSQAVLEDFGSQLPDEGQRYLRMIRQGAQRMGALIDDLLTFARLSRMPLLKTTVDTGRLVDDVLSDLGPQREGRHVEICRGNLPPCQGDRSLLKQVWINLLSNALKFTGAREHACVEVGCLQEPREDVYFVRDNGAGFDMQFAGKLFGVFQRLHRAEDYEGTGVGLAIVQRVVHRHGGRVWADAVEGRGATFFFTLSEGRHDA